MLKITHDMVINKLKEIQPQIIGREGTKEYFEWLAITQHQIQYQYIQNKYKVGIFIACEMADNYDWENDKPTDEYLIKMASEKI